VQQECAMSQTKENRRRFTRVPFCVDANLNKDEQTWPVRIADLSIRGALLELPAGLELRLNDEYLLTVRLEGSTIDLRFTSKPVRQENNRGGFTLLAADIETLTHIRALLEYNTGDPDGVLQELLTLATDGSS
jgi:hypothetical protein